MPTQRLAWPDIARALSIIGVIVLHVTLVVPTGESTLLAGINELFTPLRMPLFFLVAGFFALKVTTLSFGELLYRRLLVLLVPYFFWAPIELYLKSLERVRGQDADPISFSQVCFQVLNGQGMYWFLLALAFFTLVLWATKRLSRAQRMMLVIGLIVLPTAMHYGLGVDAVAGSAADLALQNMEKYARYLPCFLLGAYLQAGIVDFVARLAHPSHLFVALGGVVAGAQLSVLHVGSWQTSLQTLISLLYLPAAIAIAVGLAHVPVLGAGLQRLGQHTLVLYLGHPIALTVGFGFLFRYADIEFGLHSVGFFDRTSTWILYCLVLSFLGGWVFALAQRVPFLGWSIKPPRIHVSTQARTPLRSSG